MKVVHNYYWFAMRNYISTFSHKDNVKIDDVKIVEIHQCIEKLFKYVLAEHMGVNRGDIVNGKGSDIHDTHNLKQLYKATDGLPKYTDTTVQALSFLTSLYLGLRYPNMLDDRVDIAEISITYYLKLMCRVKLDVDEIMRLKLTKCPVCSRALLSTKVCGNVNCVFNVSIGKKV